MADDNRQSETWTYAGIRTAKGKKYHAWQDAKGGELMYFAKIGAGAVGGQYTFDVLRAEDGTFQSVYSGTRTWASSKHEDADLVAQWQTEHRLAQAELARDQAERRAKAEPDAFELAMQPLRELRAKSCRTYADRTAFLAMVIESLGR